MATTFRGDPYKVLGVPPDASDAAIKKRWRELAREHHPDRAAGDDADRLTRRMARINAAYDVLRDPKQRARLDERAGRWGMQSGPSSPLGEEPGFPDDVSAPWWSGPPRPRPSRPVTGRIDTTALFRRRNATTTASNPPLDGQRPIGSRERGAWKQDLRASQTAGPVLRRQVAGRVRIPTLDEARAVRLLFGKFRGRTLGEVEAFEPTYIDWIARTITRDRELVVSARVVQEEMDRNGVVRSHRPATPGFGAARQRVPA